MPLRDCRFIVYTVGWVGVAAGLSSALLFLFRVNGVYYDSLTARTCFTCMWLITAGCLLFLPVPYTAAPAQPNSLCVIVSSKRFGVALLIPVAIFDWVVFLAISLRVIQLYGPQTHWCARLKMLVTGAGTSAIPRTLLRTGQLYIMWVYLILRESLRADRSRYI